MTSYTLFFFLLLLAGCRVCISQEKILKNFEEDASHYCRICSDHTMCQFPQDDVGKKCVKFEEDDLDKKDIRAIVDWHNVYRNTVASGEESRGKPGPQPPAKNMMELMWDEELAQIARRWALQCSLFERDQCRDVARFEVWQNVHVLDMDSVGSSTSTARIHFHVQSWYDEVERFDSAEVGLVNFSAPEHLYYVPFALATITYVGCGRTIYTTGPDLPGQMNAITSVRFGNRVETLVCNYGPFDRTTSRELYEAGAPGLCPSGMIRSSRYGALCQKFQEQSSRRNTQQRMQTEQVEQRNEGMNSGTFPTTRAVYLYELLLLVTLIDIIAIHSLLIV